MKRILISAIALIAIGVAGVYAYSTYKERQQFKTKFQEAIGRDAGFTETILKIEQDSSKMTYAEVFQMCDKSIEGRDALVVDLRGLYPNFHTELKDKLISFLNLENDVIRAKRDMYRKRLHMSSAFDSYKEAVSDAPTSYYGLDVYTSRTNRARKEMADAAAEAQTSAKEFDELYAKALNQEPQVQSAAIALGLQYEPTFKKHEASNKKTTKDTLDMANSIFVGLKSRG